MPELISLHEMCKDLKEVTSTKIVMKRKFHPEGLFSEQIFGPVKNYTCHCGIYHGASSSGKTCKTCGIDIVHSKERRKRFAKIVLPVAVVNPIYYDLVCSVGGTTVKKYLNDLMTNETKVLYVNSDRSLKEFYIADDGNPDFPASRYDKLEKTEAIVSLIDFLASDNMDSRDWRFIKENLDKMIITEILVLPPDLRPASKSMTKDSQMATDKINRFYMQLLTKKEIMRNTILNISRNRSLYYTYFKQIQKDVFELYEHIIEKLSKKEGLVRGNILGKRTDFSGRAVIVPEPSLKIDECYLPYLMVLELFKLPISKRLLETGKFKLINSAIEYVDKCIDHTDYSLMKMAEEITENEVCLLNRQPSLHRLGLLGFKIKITPEPVIKIHPLICSGYNADFDGDQMAVYLPISEKTKQEVRDKFLCSKNFYNITDASLSTLPSQDIVLGMYILTQNMIPDLAEPVEYKGETTTKGIKLFNECLPEDYPLIKHVVKKKELVEVLNDINRKYPENVMAIVLDKIKEVGFACATLYGVSISLENMKIPGIEKLQAEIYDENKTPREQADAISSKETEDFVKKNFKYAYLIESGARGSWDQARQIVMTRGYVANFRGDIIQTPIKSNLLDGLSPEEFFNSTYGCRKGLLDTAINTGVSGYLSRKLIFSCSNLQKHSELDDCGTKDYLNVFVDSDKKAKMLEFRYYLNPSTNQDEIITVENMKSLVGQVIKLRSPIYCKSDKVCHKCYGDLYKLSHTRFVGILAAQALGEVGTQMVLRIFHTSGVAVIKDAKPAEDGVDDILKQTDVISDLSTASRLLHVKDKQVTPDKLVSDLYKVYSPLRNIHHVHYEAIVSQLMWVGLRKWRSLANREKYAPQFSSIQSVPEKESWILGLAFSNTKKNALRGIVYRGHYTGIYDNILLGRHLNDD
jgi:DNA-directed RNA polymerase subunit beta'